jgi:hypothetical protein
VFLEPGLDVANADHIEFAGEPYHPDTVVGFAKVEFHASSSALPG